MKKYFLIPMIIFHALIASAQRFEWISYSTQGIPNNWSPDAVDPAGNIYTLIGTSPGGAIIQGDTIPGLAPGDGVIITKFSPTGNFLWGKMVSCDGGGVGGPLGITVDNAGAVYASIEFGNGGNVNMLDTVFLSVAAGGSAGVVIKLDNSGNFVHAKIVLNAYGPQITGDGNYIYVASHNTIEKLDTALNTVWLKSGPSGAVSFCADGSGGADIFAFANGELLASCREGGNNTGAVPFSNDSIYFSPPGYDEVAVVKMDTSGQILWSRTLPNAGATVPAASLDSQGNVYLGMKNANIQYIFAGDTLYNSGSAYCGIFKWDAAGNPLWARGLYSQSGTPEPFDMAVNAQDELLISGQASSDFTFDNDTLFSAQHNIFLIKISPVGNFMWHKSDEALLFSTSYSDGIAVRNGNEYLLAGSTHNPATYQFGCIDFTTPLFTNFITYISEQPEWNPIASFTYTISNDTTYIFTDASTDATSWHWDFGDGYTSNAQSPSHNFTSGGSYTVVLTVFHGACSSTDTLQIIGVGIIEINMANTFLVYPNPSSGNFTITFPEVHDKVSIDIYSALGERIYSESACSLSKKKISMNGISEGIYFIKVLDGKKLYRKKIFIQHD